MLVLTRKISQTINIGDDILVHVLGTSGRYVRLGIDAPRSIDVHRSEIYKRLQTQLLKADVEC